MNSQHLKACCIPLLTYLIGRESSGYEVVEIEMGASKVQHSWLLEQADEVYVLW